MAKPTLKERRAKALAEVEAAKASWLNLKLLPLNVSAV